LLVYVNGQIVDGNTASVSIWDGGFLYGDGIFTTLRLYNGLPLDTLVHHQRLRRQARLLDLPLTITEDTMADVLTELAQANNLSESDSRARVTISRGFSFDSPLPLTDLINIDPTTVITVSPLPEAVAQMQLVGIPVVTLGPAFVKGNLPNLKTLNALPTLMALRKAHAAGCPEALLLGKEDNILEGAISNVFLVVNDRILTPHQDEEMLAGRTRARVISSANHLGYDLEEKKLQREYLNRAQEIFMTNSVREIVPVISVDGKPVGSGLPGPITRRLQDKYRGDIKTSLGLS